MYHREATFLARCLLAVGALVVGVAWTHPVALAQTTPRPVTTAVAAPLPFEDTFEFEFKDLPWDKVLERYSSISRLAFAGNYIPGGTATFIPPKGKRQYTVREITDIINEMLLSRPASKYLVEAIDGKIPEKAARLRKRLELEVPQYSSTVGVTLKDHLEYIQDRYSGDRGDDVNVNLSFTINDKAFTDAEQKAVWETGYAKIDWTLRDAQLDTILEKLCGKVRVGNSDLVFIVRSDHIELTTSKLAALEDSYLLVHLDNTFTILRAGQKIDSALVPRVRVADLASRGKTELVSAVIPLKTLNAAEIAPDIQKQLGPFFGDIVILGKSNQLLLRDTAAKLMQIHAVLTELEIREGEKKRDKGK